MHLGRSAHMPLIYLLIYLLKYIALLAKYIALKKNIKQANTCNRRSLQTPRQSCVCVCVCVCIVVCINIHII